MTFDRHSLRMPFRATSKHFLFLLVLAVLLRVLFLKLKPPHYDEGINGNFIMEMWRTGCYRYDPSNYHGPLHFYILQIFEQIFGPGIWAFRVSTGLASILTLRLLWLSGRWLGRGAQLAAWIWALSAGAVFYSRYAIHESWFVFSQVLFFHGFFLYRETQSRKSFAMVCAAIVMSLALKETFFIFYGTFAIAIFIMNYVFPRLEGRFGFTRAEGDEFKGRTAIESRSSAVLPSIDPMKCSTTDRGLIIFIAIVAWAALFSGFASNPSGIFDFFRAFHFWVKTGVEHSGHEKPFFYWLSLLFEYEWPIFCALLFLPFGFLKGSWWTRFLGLLSIGTFLAYSLIPYKTTWCVINLIWPFTMFAGSLVRDLHGKWNFPVRGLLILLTVLSLGPSLRVNFFKPADPTERYAYVQTRSDVAELFALIESSQKLRPSDQDLRWIVGIIDSWPLAWMLHRFNSVRFARVNAEQFYPEGIDVADVLLIEKSDQAKVEELLQGKYRIREINFRDSYEQVLLYIRDGLFLDLPGHPVPGTDMGVRSFHE